MFFEEQPWMLVVLIIVVVEAWSYAKSIVKNWLADRQPKASPPPG